MFCSRLQGITGKGRGEVEVGVKGSRTDSGGFRGVGGREDTFASSAGNAEGCDEDVHEHDEVQQVRRHVLPEGNLAERQSLLTILILLLQDSKNSTSRDCRM